MVREPSIHWVPVREFVERRTGRTRKTGEGIRENPRHRPWFAPRFPCSVTRGICSLARFQTCSRPLNSGTCSYKLALKFVRVLYTSDVFL